MDVLTSLAKITAALAIAIVTVLAGRLIFPNSAMASGWKAAITVVAALPLAVVFIFYIAMWIWSLAMMAAISVLPRPVCETLFSKTASSGVLLVVLLAYYFIPTIKGVLYVSFCAALHVWAWQGATPPRPLVIAIIATSLITLCFTGYVLWWHLTGQKFGYL